jgi:tetratricopeptide (TPR) repeat protein
MLFLAPFMGIWLALSLRRADYFQAAVAGGLLTLFIGIPGAMQISDKISYRCWHQSKNLDKTIKGCSTYFYLPWVYLDTLKVGSVYEERGSAYEKNGLYDQAIADYHAALKIYPNDINAQNGLKRLGVTP